MNRPIRGYLDTRWGQLHYSEQGSGEHTVVLFHETPLSHRAFERLAPALSGSFRTIAFDTAGYGESDPPPSITTIEEYAQSFLEGLDALGVDKAVLYGVHTGASYAIEIAASAPDRVEALIVSGVPFYPEEVRLAKRVPDVPEFVDDGSHLVASFSRPPKEYDNLMLSRMAGSVAERPDRVFWSYQAVYDYRPDLTLPRVSAPMLFATNAVDVLHPSDQMAKELVPHAEMVFIGTDRLPLYWTESDALAAEIEKFVTDL